MTVYFLTVVSCLFPLLTSLIYATVSGFSSMCPVQKRAYMKKKTSLHEYNSSKSPGASASLIIFFMFIKLLLEKQISTFLLYIQ